MGQGERKEGPAGTPGIPCIFETSQDLTVLFGQFNNSHTSQDRYRRGTFDHSKGASSILSFERRWRGCGNRKSNNSTCEREQKGCYAV